MSNNKIDLDEAFDFGFSTVSEDEIEPNFIQKKNLEDSLKDIRLIYRLITPLITNLLRDADEKPYIHWPNRKEKLQEFKNKLDFIFAAYK